MKLSGEDTRRENRILHRENAMLEDELAGIRKHNKVLRSKVKHLEKLVYGTTKLLTTTSDGQRSAKLLMTLDRDRKRHN
jgi:hypothetical protein